MFIKKEEVVLSNTKVRNPKAVELENYIRENIPLTNYMEFRVADLQDYSIKLTVPIEPNGNHYNTAFGGSIATLGILSGWALLHAKMVEEKIKGTLVIQQSTTKYISPARTDFEASCTDLTASDWVNFKKEMRKKGKAKLHLHSELKSKGKLVAKQESIYVGLAKER